METQASRKNSVFDWKQSLTSVSRSDILILVRDSLDIVLMEGRYRAETLPRAYVALCTALSPALLQVALDHLTIVHVEARVCSHTVGVERGVQSRVRLQRVARASLVAAGSGTAHVLRRVVRRGA